MGKFSIIGMMGMDTSKFDDGVTKSKGKASKFGSFMKGAFVAGIAAAGVALAAFAKKGIGDFIEMDKKAREVFTLIPDASESMRKKLVKGANEIATAYGVPVTDALQGMYDALSAGIPKENVVDFLKVASDAAKGGVSDLGTAVGAITTVLNGYGMEAKSARDVSDVLFTVVKGGVTNFNELGANIGKVTPIASALGVEFSEVGAMFDDLTGKLGKGKTAEAGTQINAMLGELAKAGTVASKNFEKLTGTTFPAFIKSGGSVKDALMAMRDSADENDQQMIDMFGSLEAGKAAMALTAEGAKGLNEALEIQAERFGATKQAADIMKESWEDKLARAGERINKIFRDVGEVLVNLGGGSGGLFEMVAGYVEVLVKYMKEGASEGGALTKVFEILGTVMKFSIKVSGTMVNTFKMIVAVAELMITNITAIGAVFKAVFDPLFKVISAGATIMGSFAKAIASGFDPSAWASFKDTVKTELGNVTDSFDNWGANLEKTMTEQSDKMHKAWDDFGNNIGDAVDEIGDIWSETGNWEFLDPKKMEAKNLEKIKKDMEEIAKGEAEARAEAERRKELAEQQAKLLKERIAKQKQLQAQEKAIQQMIAKSKQINERIKALEAGKAELVKKIAERRAKINDHIKDEVNITSQALGIVGKLLDKEGMRLRDKRRLWAIQAQLKKNEQEQNDATEEGLKALKEQKQALELIAQTEENILRRKLKANGHSEQAIELRLKERPAIKAVAEELNEVNKRIEKAENKQKRVNKLFPQAKVLVNGVAMGAGKLEQELGKAKDQQQNLKVKTEQAVQGFKAMGGEAKTIEEGLRQVADELDSVKFGADDMKLDVSEAEKLPEVMDTTKTKMQEVNDIAKENELVKLANAGTIDVKTSSPIPVEMKGVKLDDKAMKSLGDAIKQTVKPIRNSEKSLKSIDKTLKGYFVNQ